MRSKPSVGDRLVERFKAFTEELENNPDDVCKRFTARKVKMDLCPQSYGAADVKLIRQKLGVSQVIFANVMGTSLGTVKRWEQGTLEPSKMACRLMDQIAENPEMWIKWLKERTHAAAH